MIGTWRWNAVLGICGGLLTFIFSLSSNGLTITAMRFVYAFAVFFALAYLFRAVLALILRTPAVTMREEEAPDVTEEKGSLVDLSTPDESDELSGMLKLQLEGKPKAENQQPALFKPLQPEKLVSTPNKEPDELAKAIRHLTGG
ncbi:hypothetical protein [Paenibacillus spongiae]|uniref:Uncharacterized protein n=1 Tax=Paenibacillus spongiae TaxID=2909671 RepID=A0ABY5SEX3_9BACL|nr:hypothetical protein [Paenibacillus spongiae]UVI32522.1 hypothetical protein L1F29_12140 [Paenibacillus spongiae]